MGVGETAKLIASLELQDKFSGAVKNVNASLGKLETRFSKIGQGVQTIGRGIGNAIRNGVLIAGVALAGLTGLIIQSVKEGQDAAKVQTIYATAIANSQKNTGAFAGKLKEANAAVVKAESGHSKNAKAIQKAKDALATLKAQLGIMGPVTRQQVDLLNRQQTALMNLGGVDDELIKSEQTRLIQMGLNGAAVATLTPLILDMSKATGKDLLTATIAVGKAVNGNVGGLARFGIVIDKTKAKMDPFGAVVDALNKKFGGTTKALSGSLEARLGALRENLANIREDMGQKLLPALIRIVDVAGKDLVPAFGKFVDRILPSVISGIDQFASMLENGGAERGINAITDALGPLVDLVKIAAEPIKMIVEAFLALPKQVQVALAAGFAINKLSEGLIAKGAVEIVGGIFKRGETPANPVYVSDVAKGLGGAAGAAGGLGLASKVFLAGEAIGLGFIVNEVRQNLADQNTAQSQNIQANLGKFLAQSPTRADLLNALGGVEQGIHDIEANPLNVLVQGEALDNLRKMRADLQAQLSKTNPGMLGLGGIIPAFLHAVTVPGTSAEAKSRAMEGIVVRATRAGFHPTSAAVQATFERNIARAAAAQKAAIDRVHDEQTRTTAAAMSVVAAVKAQERNQTPITNVTVNVTAAQVAKSVTIQRRFGPPGGSRERGPTEFDA